MHFHADHGLFFERRQSVWRAGVTLAITICVLFLNAGLQSASASLTGSCIAGTLLVVAYLRGHRRLAPALLWTVALVIFALLAGVALSGDLAHLLDAAARISCGVLWVLWLGTQLDWPSLRQLMLAGRIPETAVATMDHALMHGVLTQREWHRRRDAARLRMGGTRLPLATWAQILGEGALQAFSRLERVEEHALVRSAVNVGGDQAPSLHLDAVQVRRHGHLVLDQLDLRLTAHEWVVVCGPSGAGKSSLLRLIAGLDGLARGSMCRLGQQVSPDAALADRLDGRVALLGQNPEHHFIASTVAEDIAWGLRHRGLEDREAHRRSVQMAQEHGIDHLLERPCHALSFGEQRRVALAGVLVLEPALLLLDEPTAGLDPVAAHELRTLVERVVHQTGAACIWATHDLESLPRDAHRMLLLKDGRVVFDGATREALDRSRLVSAGLAVPTPGEESPVPADQERSDRPLSSSTPHICD